MKPRLLPLLCVLHAASAIQPTAPEAKPAQLYPLQWGRLNFLATTDTHGWHAGHLQEHQYSADWGDYLSFTKHMRALADKQGVDLLLVDTGDRIEGSGLSDTSKPKGKYVREIFSSVDMDVVTIGNHELYKEMSSVMEYLVMRPHYGEAWVVSNVDIYHPSTGELVPLGNRFRKFKTKNQGVRVTAFAFLFDFFENYNNTVVYEVEKSIREPWFLNAISDPDVDIFVIIGHTPVRDSPEFPAILAAIRIYHPTTPVQFFGGHTHIRDFSVYDKASTGLESGRYCETVGFLSISHLPSAAHAVPVEFNRRYIDFNRYSFHVHSNVSAAEFDTEQGVQVSRRIGEIRKSLGLERVYGCAPKDYYMFRVPYPHEQSLYSLLAEKVLPEMVRKKERRGKPTLIFINSGSQRFDLLKGPFTQDSSYTITPFTSTFRYIRDVPYSKAKRLIRLFNRDGKPWLSTELEAWASAPIDTSDPLALEFGAWFPELHPGSKAKGTRAPPIGPLEPYFYGRKQMKRLTDRSTKEYVHVPHRHGGDPRQRVFGGEGDDGRKDDNGKDAALTPGYTTHDDFPPPSDDTPHRPIKYYFVPNAIVANHSFPEGIDEEAELKVDVVFFDFIERYVLAGLWVLGVRVGESEVEEYLGRDVDFGSLLRTWVGRNWPCER
ncbi:Metallo-dependent phosphatase-like protein [Kalaharituber pfeilii]|nr:Metallo-dependent phosphatase-like protein [Kalaharituber pfeilii]